VPVRPRLLVLTVLALLSMGLTVAGPAAPARADVVTYACNPSATGWNLEGSWPGGTVLEARTCLQNEDSVLGDVRVRSQWRVRNGTTPISGTDWDLDSNGDGLPFQTYIQRTSSGTIHGPVSNYPDLFNTSIVTLYSNFTCAGSGDQGYAGKAFDLRATPPGLPRSGYRLHNSLTAFDGFLACP
jgi:hypothetical protein